MKLGRLLMRLVIGGLFVGHGTQKLFGWFGGPGPDRAAQMMASLELDPPRQHALLAGATEAGGGVMLAAGMATPLAAAGLIGVMLSAIRIVHAKNGPWATDGGYEYHLVLIASLLGLVDGGPGDWSVDGALGIDDTGPAWALGSLALGAAASVATIEVGRRRARAARPVTADAHFTQSQPVGVEAPESAS